MLSATKNFLNKNYKYINLWRKIANKLNYIKLKPFMYQQNNQKCEKQATRESKKK